MKIDLASIDRESFDVKERDGRFLINPSKRKHIWTENELHLRSLLTDAEGNVLSSGLPKFMNYSEIREHDDSFLAALAEDRVTFTEKMDGSLIILDWIDGKAHFRTRGNFDLGDFYLPIVETLFAEHPKLLEWYATDPFVGDICRRYYSLLFEYTSPENRIVLRYEKPSLTLLGMVDKHTLVPFVEESLLKVIALQSGVPLVPVHVLPTNYQELAPIVRGWTDKEGVVATFMTEKFDGTNVWYRPRFLKIKASQYVKLHAIKFKLEGKVAKLAFLLGIRSQADVLPKLSDMGIDFEAAEYIRPEMDTYLAHLALLEFLWGAFTLQLNEIERAINEHDEPRLQRKRFVELVREEIAAKDVPQSFFGAAMKLRDGDEDAAWMQVAATEILKESVGAVRNWLTNPQVALGEMFHSGKDED